MKKKKHVISRVLPGSIGEELELEPGDILAEINHQLVEDVFDYRYLMNDEYIELLIEKANGELWELEVEKDYDEDLGIEFENGLMDDYRSCSNHCMFCFIDQMPPGMRETLYFKDDDSRLSFLQGNYVTLTNMSQEDIERVIKYHLSPINVSFQAMNPQLRCKMLHNRFAGDALKKVDQLYEAGITMNGQIVLCKGVNDGEELEYSLQKMSEYAPVLQSVSVVPVGLTKFRKGLYPLEPLQKKMRRRFWNRSIAGRRSCMRDMVSTLSMPLMNGIFWRGRNSRKKIAMTAICSWKTVWACCGFWVQRFGRQLRKEMEMTGNFRSPLRQEDLQLLI